MNRKLSENLISFLCLIALQLFFSCDQIVGDDIANSTLPSGIEGKWETGIFEGYSTIEISKDSFSKYSEPTQYVVIEKPYPGMTMNTYNNNDNQISNLSGTYSLQANSIVLVAGDGTTLALVYSQSGNVLTLTNADTKKGMLKYDRVVEFGSQDIPASRIGGNNSTSILSGVFEMKGLGYNDYVDGGHCGYGYDFSNKTIRTISSIRTKTYTINKYSSFGNMTYTFTSNQNINPMEARRNFWIYLGDTNTFYSSHTVNEVLITFSDGKEYLWTK